MRRAALALFATVAGLVGLLSFKTHSAPLGAAPAAVSTAGPGTSRTTKPSSATKSSPATTSSSATGSKQATVKTVTGKSINTQWGPVKVRITVTNGTLTAVTAVVYPSENPRDQQINAYAIPALDKEALAAGSAKIDMISGATYTSTGYIDSLQSALDRAGR